MIATSTKILGRGKFHRRLILNSYLVPDSVQERDAEGYLPLDLHVVARRSRHAHALAIARFLLERHPESIRDGANVQEEEEENRHLSVHAALDNGAPLEVVRLFVRRYPKSLEQWTGSGSLALHLAVSSEAPPETIEFLVQQCPQAVRAVERDRYGCITLHCAACTRNPELRTQLHLLSGSVAESVLFRNAAGLKALHLVANEDGIPLNSKKFAAMCLLVELGPGALRMRDSYGADPATHIDDLKDPGLPVVQYLVNAWPKSVLVPAADGRYPLFLAAANLSASLDVLYSLVKQWPGHYFVREGESVIEEEASP
jgi:hypothetical protein